MNPHHAIIHVGTNELNNVTEVERTVKSIVGVEQMINSNKCGLCVSSLSKRNDKWKGKTMEVNRYLEDMCTAFFHFILLTIPIELM